jgi:hypothetical protein
MIDEQLQTAHGGTVRRDRPTDTVQRRSKVLSPIGMDSGRADGEDDPWAEFRCAGFHDSLERRLDRLDRWAASATRVLMLLADCVQELRSEVSDLRLRVDEADDPALDWDEDGDGFDLLDGEDDRDSELDLRNEGRADVPGPTT